jgi:hypothetical protein
VLRLEPGNTYAIEFRPLLEEKVRQCTYCLALLTQALECPESDGSGDGSDSEEDDDGDDDDDDDDDDDEEEEGAGEGEEKEAASMDPMGNANDHYRPSGVTLRE